MSTEQLFESSFGDFVEKKVQNMLSEMGYVKYISAIVVSATATDVIVYQSGDLATNTFSIQNKMGRTPVADEAITVFLLNNTLTNSFAAF